MKTLGERCRAIELLVVDVDGVLTAGGIILGAAEEIKRFHTRDGFGFHRWHKAGKRSAIITGRRSAAVERRAAELGIGFVVQGAADKGSPYQRVLAEAGVAAESACCIGDDVPDLPLLRECGLAVAVADASAELRAIAHYITRTPGGGGAVREVVQLILRCQGHWEAIG